MNSIRDWAFPEMLANSLALASPLPGSDSFHREATHDDDEPSSSGSSSTDSAVAVSSQRPVGAENRNNLPSCQPLVSSKDSSNVHNHTQSKKMDDPLSRIEALQIMFFRALHRLQRSSEDPIVAKVLYRMHLATLIQAGDSELRRINLNSDKARAIVAEAESIGQPELDFSLRILVLGKTGVGKSATINSVIDQTKAATDAFQPATDRIQEVVGVVNGIRISFIDTPGFSANSANRMRRNRRIMHSIKRYIRKSPPDIVLYFERLDLMNLGYSDFPLLKLITEVFGSAIWFNTILVMTHASSAAREGPGGLPLKFDSYATQCADLLRHHIHQSISDHTKLENPVVLVENHRLCRKNDMGEKILPNGQAWKSQFMFLCVCAKVLSDANCFLRLEKSIVLRRSSTSRFLSIPHLLSSLLKQRSVVSAGGAEDDVEEYLLSGTDEEDEYDQLPPIRILKKAEFEKLSDSHRKDYLDELYYREMLFLKKQMKEESRRRREHRSLEEVSVANDENSEESNPSPEAFPLPDMAIPPSFDSDCIMYRYQGQITSDQWLWRPVLDPHGWDHDVGFDGVNLDTTIEVKRNIIASVSGQMRKDKQDFNIQSEFSSAYSVPGLCTYIIGLDVQSTDNNIISTLHSDAKLRNMKSNIPGCGISMTSFQNKYYVGAKFEDAVYIGKRLKLVVNAGRMRGFEEAAFGWSIEATLKGRDYPVRNDRVSTTMSFLSSKDDRVLGVKFESEFCPRRGVRLCVNANLNSRKMGKLCIKTSSSEHFELAFLALFSVFRVLSRIRE